MDMKAKTLITLAIPVLLAAGCSNTNGVKLFSQNGEGGTGQVNKADGTTHTHNGVPHTHPLPDTGLSHTHQFNTGGGTTTCTPCGSNNTTVVGAQTNNNSGNCHLHSGRRHCHPLPASGNNHSHSQGTGTTNVSSNTVNNQSYYDNNTNTGANYYNYGNNPVTQKGVVQHTHNGKRHAHKLPASGMNHNHNQGSTSFGGNFGGGSTAGGNSGSGGGNVYVVQRGDTVFQVMRNTGVYWKDIIRLNNLQAPNYQIVPGQQLRLR